MKESFLEIKFFPFQQQGIQMSTTPTSKAPMQAEFSDFDSNQVYDRSIATAKNRMKTLDPCSSMREMSALLSKLSAQQGEYYRVPLPEGYCLGLMTPHRSRISRRISALTLERDTYHVQMCTEYARSQTVTAEKEKHERTLESNRKIEIEKERIRCEAAKSFENTRRGFEYNPK